MFRKYDDSTFKRLAEQKQHNILVLVGNGFDIAILNKYKKNDRKRKTTSYQDFYEYIQYYRLANENNRLYCKMKEDRESGKEDWSDFENSIYEMLPDANVNLLSEDADEFHEWFTMFLNDIIDSDLLIKLNSVCSLKNKNRESP